MSEESIIAAEIIAQERNWAVPSKAMNTETPEEMQQTTVSKQKSANAKGYWARMTPEERSAENKRRAAMIRAKKLKGTFHPYPDPETQALAATLAEAEPRSLGGEYLKGHTSNPQATADLIALSKRLDEEADAALVASMQGPPTQGPPQDVDTGHHLEIPPNINPVTPLAALKAEYQRRITLIEEVETWLP